MEPDLRVGSKEWTGSKGMRGGKEGKGERREGVKRWERVKKKKGNFYSTCSFTSSPAIIEIARPDVPARPTRPTVK